jgi:hypothetical protein
MKIADVNEIIEEIKSLKIKLVKVQDYHNASMMRDMEKEYLDKEVDNG